MYVKVKLIDRLSGSFLYGRRRNPEPFIPSESNSLLWAEFLTVLSFKVEYQCKTVLTRGGVAG